MSVPTGYCSRIVPQSWLAVKKFIDIGAILIDEDNRVETGVVQLNHSKKFLRLK